jgi:ankyrin repeat protein
MKEKKTGHKSQKSKNLIDAVIGNNLSLVNDLISQGVRLDSKSDKGLTALYEAVQCSYEEIALVLIEAGANINVRDRRGNSILMEAIKRNQKRVVQQLLSRGVGIHVRNKARYNALMIAAALSSSDVIRELVAHGANIKENDFESLGQAVAFKNIEAIQTLLELGADPNACIDSNGNTLLMTAVLQKCTEAVEILISNNANLKAVNIDGQSVLDLSKSLRLRKITQILTPYFSAQ